MPNPKQISSYDPRLIMLIHRLAENDEPQSVPFDLGSTSSAVTFASRFSTLKNLLAKQASAEGNDYTAAKILACRLKAREFGHTESGARRPTSWDLCNGPEARRRDPAADAIEGALAALDAFDAPFLPQEEETPPEGSAISRYYGKKAE